MPRMEPVKRQQLTSEKPPPGLRLRICMSDIFYRNQNKAGNTGTVVRLLGKRIAKLYTHPNELDVMDYIRKHTTIPIPEVYEAYVYGDTLHMVMEEVSGDHAAPSEMTPEQGKVFMKDFTDYLSQLRALKPPKEGHIGSCHLGPGLDHRLGSTRWGPFENIADFHTYLRRGRPVEHWDFEPTVVKVHKRPEKYSVRFAHGDLYPGNIITDKAGRITAIIDWEFGGWYPEYWEYTKLYWGEAPAFKKFYEVIEAEPSIPKYPDELQAERDIWKHMNPFSYDAPPWSPEDDKNGKQSPESVP